MANNDDNTVNEVTSKPVDRKPPAPSTQATATAQKTEPKKEIPKDKGTPDGAQKDSSTLSQGAREQGSTTAGAGTSNFASAWGNAAQNAMNSRQSPSNGGASGEQVKNNGAAGGPNAAKPGQAGGAAGGPNAAKPGQAGGAAGSPDAAKAGQAGGADAGKMTVQRAADLINMGLHLPGALNALKDIKEKGFTKENVAGLKEAEPYISKVITKENLNAIKNLKPEEISKALSKENIEKVKEQFPELGKRIEQMKPEELGKKVTDGLTDVQKKLDKGEVEKMMKKMEPWVDTQSPDGKINNGHLTNLQNQLNDPRKLGGADKNFSLNDTWDVVNGFKGTQTGTNAIANEVAKDPRVNYRTNWRGVTKERLPIGKSIAMGIGMKTENVAPAANQKLAEMGLGRPSTGEGGVCRNFSENDVQQILNMGKDAKGFLGNKQPGGQPQTEGEKMARIMGDATKIFEKSVNLKDGLDARELAPIRDVANLSYRLLDKLRNNL